jgi:hypothetical protein
METQLMTPEQMTPKQASANGAAQQELIPGCYYRFDPPVTAMAFSTGGPNACAPEECSFDRGWYLGFRANTHVFQGKPINDQREIPVPAGYEGVPGIQNTLRESYFHVLFIGGSKAVLDSDQSPRK